MVGSQTGNVRKGGITCTNSSSLIRQTKKFVNPISTGMKPVWKWKITIENSMTAVMQLSHTSADKKSKGR